MCLLLNKLWLEFTNIQSLWTALQNQDLPSVMAVWSGFLLSLFFLTIIFFFVDLLSYSMLIIFHFFFLWLVWWKILRGICISLTVWHNPRHAEPLSTKCLVCSTAQSHSDSCECNGVGVWLVLCSAVYSTLYSGLILVCAVFTPALFPPSTGRMFEDNTAKRRGEFNLASKIRASMWFFPLWPCL